MPSRKEELYEVAIVGAGPAGLAAAVYLGRFLRSAVVFDAGDARAKLIPKTHNCPGFPEGISGISLMKRLKRQAARYGARIVAGRVERLENDQESFLLDTSSGRVRARCVILATGIVDRAPALPNLKKAIAAGLIRLCPVCDAYEVQGRRVGVIGPEDVALREAIFLRDFTPYVSILCNFPADFSPLGRARAKQQEIEICDAVVKVLQGPEGFEIVMTDADAVRTVDVIYPSMGCEVRNELAVAVGAECDDEGYIRIGSHLETTIAGLYAIGDVANALNQIAVGFGHAALSTTHIHNFLSERSRR